jgi:hypothetical protein
MDDTVGMAPISRMASVAGVAPAAIGCEVLGVLRQLGGSPPSSEVVRGPWGYTWGYGSVQQ